ncbi:MAG: hypothetical protein DHS20C01_26990 [marine bacterium B5-7]|nr:MAG: hypothetical protein DHS20C01_26990 [marine bacterium B5-7]
MNLRRTSNHSHHRQFVDRQRGVSLAISLALLTMLTALGVTALRITSMDERMAGNMQQESIAFQAAETGLSMLWGGALSLTTEDSADDADTVTYLCDSSVSTCNDSVDKRKKIKVSTNSRYAGQGKSAPTGYSMDSGFARHYFALESHGQHIGKTTDVYAGFHRVGPRFGN